MCGIVGCNYKASNFDKALNLLEHRGPDNSSIYEWEDKLFGHTRLSIIDLDKEANQPMVFEDCIITFNGEIYNYKELIEQEDLVCKTKSDTEVIVRLYQKYGFESLEFLEGMFSFCIYEKRSKRYFCARDRFGEKPFYYFFKNNKFIFASEIKSILSLLNYTPDIDKRAFLDYLQSSSARDKRTTFSDIYKLPKGHFLVIDKHLEIKIECYFSLDDLFRQREDISSEDATKKLEELLKGSVLSRTIADVDVGVLLSGGVDSSLLASIYSQSQLNKISTYSIGYKDYEKFDETHYARKVADFIGSKHHELTATKEDFKEAFELVVSDMDDLICNSAMLPTSILASKVKELGTKCVLCGEGSDELFMGYSEQREAYRKLKNGSEHRYTGMLSNWTSDELDMLIVDSSLVEFLAIPEEKTKESSALSSIILEDYSHWLGGVLLTKLDRATMLYGLEARSPFLDLDLVKFGLSLPLEIYLLDEPKWLLKRVAKKYLPEDIVYRKKKGFSSPYLFWHFESYGDTVLEEILDMNNLLGWFDSATLVRLVEAGKKGINAEKLWSLIIFSHWIKKYF